MKKKILVTGNSGYIGSHLTNILLSDKNIEVYGLDKQIPKIPVTKHFNFDINDQNLNIDESFYCVIHLAAEISVPQSTINPILYYQTNIQGTMNVLKNIKFEKFIFASTGSASLLSNPYSISKKCAEDIVEQFCQERSIPFLIFRFYNVVGADVVKPSNPDGLMWNLINAKKTGKFCLFGTDYNTPDGSAIRDYVHVNEICHSIIKSLDFSSNQVENLGHGVGTSVIDMINIFKRVNNCNFIVENCARRPGDIEISVLNNPSKFMINLYRIEEILNYKEH